MKKMIKMTLISSLMIFIFLACTKQSFLKIVEDQGYVLEKQDTSYCDLSVQFRYDILKDNQVIGYIYQFEFVEDINLYLENHPEVKENQIYDFWIVYAEEEVLNKLNNAWKKK